MVINFYVGFRSVHGQSIAVKIVPFKEEDVLKTIELPLHYLNESYWHAVIKTAELGITDEFGYSYIYRDEHTGEEKEFCKDSFMSIKKIDAKRLEIVDEWKDGYELGDVFSSKPFATVFNQFREKFKASEPAKNPTHIFRVKAPGLGAGKAVCLAGSGKKLNDWSSTEPLIFEPKKSYWQLKINLSKEKFPVEYKLGIYDLQNRQMEFEQGGNRILPLLSGKDTITVLHHSISPGQHRWKGAGVNVPVSALRSENSWGVGDFTDLHLLTDISKETGIKLIQLLPINDTTSTHTNKDSYPYSAVSAFALHPIYLNVAKLAFDLEFELDPEILETASGLNKKPSLHYGEVLELKTRVIRLLYENDKDFFKNDLAWFTFFELNREWLVPYAAYCYLRDKNGTADYNDWQGYESYDEDAIQALVSPENDFYDDVVIHYFTQYYLHLQLKEAVLYAHRCGVIIKGDLPIGVGRYSADAWMYRSLFHMDMQAGAPPDAFATKGQNWSFPTYNWQKMAADDYAWWRQRMEHMSNYFDAIRIDHVLGFFRIWSIPLNAIEGILGKFVPAWPLSHHDLSNAGINFYEDRFCEPYITEQLLYNWFGNDAAMIKDQFLTSNYRFKEAFNSQRKIAAWLKENMEYAHLQTGLFDLLSNIICIKDTEYPYNYHFRISMRDTDSYKALPYHEQQALNGLFDEYFFNKQNKLWEEEGTKKLAALKRSTNMLICAEDLGMVPQMVEGVLSNMHMLALEVQRMPKKINELFSNPYYSPYLSVVTPSTHDMPTIREWWEEDRGRIQRFYNQQLGQHGDSPYFAEPWVCREILKQHLHSPAMWAVFLMQDILSMDENLRIANPAEERINNPADPDHYWNYRMHVKLEDLKEQDGFILSLKEMIQESGR